MGKKGDRDLCTTRGRFLFLLDSLFTGNRSEMARSVGISQPVVSKIALGLQEPGQSVLRRLAQHPRVNPQWLFTGEGEPLLPDKEGEPVGGWPVPVVREPLPGPPSKVSRSEMLYYPVPRSQYSESRYFLEVHRSEPVVQSARAVLPGDLLLVEADQSRNWTVDEVDERLCIVRHEIETVIRLAAVTFHPGTRDEPSALMADFFLARGDEGSSPGKTITINVIGTEAEIVSVIEIVGRRAKPESGRSYLDFAHRQSSIQLADIAGVVIHLVRRDP